MPNAPLFATTLDRRAQSAELFFHFRIAKLACCLSRTKPAVGSQTMRHTYLLTTASGLKVLPGCRKDIPELCVIKFAQFIVQMSVAHDVQDQTERIVDVVRLPLLWNRHPTI